MAFVTRRSQFTGVVHTREVPVDPDHLLRWSAERTIGVGRLVQEEFPGLSADDREFILSGVTPEEWTEYMCSASDDVEDN